MKKMIVVVLSIVVLASLTGAVNAGTKTAEEQAATSKKVDKTEKQATTKKVAQTEEKATPQIGSTTEEVQGRGLPKAFSGSEEGQ